MQPVQTGLENICQNPPSWIDGCRLGLLCNPASIDRHYNHARDLISLRFPGQLNALFAPQHGINAEKQDNMIESADGVDPVLNIPIFSLYSTTRIPTTEMLASIDVLLVDLQDVGTRVYTFIYTLSYCMEVAREHDTKVVVLDRPNPIGGNFVEGNCVAPDCTSFVGRFSIPMRHGLTIGELALLFNRQFDISCDLEVIPMKNWQRSMYHIDTGLPWIPPSPNLPTPTSALVYPGQVIWEGTNVSEGRGTTQPFEIFGAPFIDSNRLSSILNSLNIPGVVLRPISFEPTSNKWAGQPCNGYQIHITAVTEYQPYLTSLRLLQEIIRNHGEDFKWKNPPYEYEYERLPIDLIIGDRNVRHRIESGMDIDKIALEWQADLSAFTSQSQTVHLYS
jgi:uncharacterized protein YbbC (DUF1343 family)